MKLVTIILSCMLAALYTSKILKPEPRNLYLIYKKDDDTLKDLAHSIGY